VSVERAAWGVPVWWWWQVVWSARLFCFQTPLHSATNDWRNGGVVESSWDEQSRRGCGWPKNRRGTKAAETDKQAKLGAMGSEQGELRERCPSGGAGGATDVLATRKAG
jgi:hypothetical protein